MDPRSARPGDPGGASSEHAPTLAHRHPSIPEARCRAAVSTLPLIRSRARIVGHAAWDEAWEATGPSSSGAASSRKRARRQSWLSRLRTARYTLADAIVGTTEGREAMELACFLREAAECLPGTAEGLTRFAPRFLLLHGPPGTGKTLLATTTASALGWNLQHLSARSVLSKWAGESEKGVAAAFEAAVSAEPCLLVLDECDALASTRSAEGAAATGGTEDVGARRVTTELLLAFNRVSGLPSCARVVVVAITNVPELLDAAFVRRFDRVVHVGLPTASERRHLLTRLLDGCPHRMDEGEIASVAAAAEGMAPSALAQWFRAAALTPVAEWLSSALGDGACAGAVGWGRVHPTPGGGSDPDTEDLLRAARPVVLADFVATAPWRLAADPVVVSESEGGGGDGADRRSPATPPERCSEE